MYQFRQPLISPNLKRKYAAVGRELTNLSEMQIKYFKKRPNYSSCLKDNSAFIMSPSHMQIMHMQHAHKLFPHIMHWTLITLLLL